MTDERDGTQEEPEVEEAFVTALGEAARRLYNAPPETPADSMWDEIQAARARSGEERAGAAEDANWSDTVRPIESAPARRVVDPTGVERGDLQGVRHSRAVPRTDRCRGLPPHRGSVRGADGGRGQ